MMKIKAKSDDDYVAMRMKAILETDSSAAQSVFSSSVNLHDDEIDEFDCDPDFRKYSMDQSMGVREIMNDPKMLKILRQEFMKINTRADSIEISKQNLFAVQNNLV